MKYSYIFVLYLGFFNFVISSSIIKGPPVTSGKPVLQKISFTGVDLKIVCPLHGFPVPYIGWTKDGDSINNYAWTRFRISKKVLKIKSVIKEDSGVYICKATNGYGSQSVRINLIIVDSTDYPQLGPGEVPSQIAPFLTVGTSRLQSALLRTTGQSIELSCEALGQPVPHITWQKDGRKFPSISTSQNPYIGLGRLSISKLTVSDTGIYSCHASNNVGQISKSFSLRVTAAASMTADPLNYYPTLIMPSGPVNTTVEEGGVARLECRVRSSTKPNIMWLKKLELWEYKQAIRLMNDVIDVGEQKFKIISTHAQNTVAIIGHNVKNDVDNSISEFLNRLVIQKVTRVDAGVYYCFVRNPQGYKYKSAYLSVIPYESSVIEPSSYHNSLADPVILIPTISLAIFVLLTCAILMIFMIKKRKGDQPKNVIKAVCDPSPSSTTCCHSYSAEVSEKLLIGAPVYSGSSHGKNIYHQQMSPYKIRTKHDVPLPPPPASMWMYTEQRMTAPKSSLASSGGIKQKHANYMTLPPSMHTNHYEAVGQRRAPSDPADSYSTLHHLGVTSASTPRFHRRQFLGHYN